MAAVALPVVALGIEAANREVRRLALGSLPFRTGQGRADQRTMYGPLVRIAVPGRFAFLFNGRIGVGGLDLGGRIGGRFERLGCVERIGFVDWFFDRHGLLSVSHRRPRTRAGLEILGGQRTPLAAARRRHPRPFVFMVRVARRAARLLDGIVDHRHDRMIGNAALARTIVVENVTEPNPALLHELPPEPIPSGGIREKQ
jgi:hypothetical protein